MKLIPSLLLLLSLQNLGLAGDEQASTTNAPSPEITGARVIGNLQDGTPPSREAPKPKFNVPAKDIVASESHKQGSREIIIQEIKPIEFPPPLKSSSEPAELSPAFQAKVDSYRAGNPRSSVIQIEATVYHSKDSATRTVATYRPGGEESPVTFCSSADFSLLSGFSSFADSQGEKHGLLMMWSSVDLTLLRKLPTTRDWQYKPPAMPDLPAGKATFVTTSADTSAESLATIQSLHDLYNNEYQKLKSAHDGRQQARLAQEVRLKAHPPKPEDITIHYWRSDKSASDSKGETAK